MSKHIKKKTLLVFAGILTIIGVYTYVVLISQQSIKRTINTRAYMTTTCESVGRQSSPLFLPSILDDYKAIYCTDTTPKLSSNDKCYTKTLACSTNRIDSKYWCVSTACYSCFNEEVPLSLCKAGAKDGMSRCMINNAKWIADGYQCDFGTSKINYNECSKDQYRCKCDDKPYPVARKDASCPIQTVPTVAIGPTAVPTPSGSVCHINDSKWITDKYNCEYGSGKLEYGKCTADGFKCKCDDASRFKYPTLQKDSNCNQEVVTTPCDMNPRLLAIKNAYNSNDMKTVFDLLKANFHLRNTQSTAGSSACYMFESRFIESGSSGYCGYLQLDDVLSPACGCVSLAEDMIKRKYSSFDYNQIKELKTCKLAIDNIVSSVR